jgi:hypothetical protein
MPPDLSSDETRRSASFAGMSAAVGAMLRTGEAWFKLTLLSLTGCSGPAWPNLDSLSKQLSISGISDFGAPIPESGFAVVPLSGYYWHKVIRSKGTP